jgi:hypothetical protein
VALVKKTGEADPVYRQALTEAVGPRAAPQDGRKVKEGILEIKDGLVYRKGMLWIPKDKDLINSILSSEHDTKIVSRTWRDRFLGAAAGAILTIAGLWFALVTGATVSYVFRG